MSQPCDGITTTISGYGTVGGTFTRGGVYADEPRGNFGSWSANLRYDVIRNVALKAANHCPAAGAFRSAL